VKVFLDINLHAGISATLSNRATLPFYRNKQKYSIKKSAKKRKYDIIININKEL
jgi:hypothetical protein